VELLNQPHRRYDPLADQWILVSAQRTQRPWQGSVDAVATAPRPTYDPDCYLCPGNTRAGGIRNPDYPTTFVFDNDFAALRPDTSVGRVEDGLLVAEGEAGRCRVVCYDPRHDLTMAGMSAPSVRGVIDLWADQTTELGRDHQWVQVFENRGEAMGASNPHPHGQIWAGTALPRDAAREDGTQRAHHAATGRRLLGDYADQESGGPRVVLETDDWLVVVPFWAGWPFETLILPKAPAKRLADLSDCRRDGLAAALVDLFGRYDRVFDAPFPYSMGWHQAPFAARGSAAAATASEAPDEIAASPHWQLHGHVYPPLLRSASVRKFMVGYELLAETQRDTLPEDAAARLAGLAASEAADTDADADADAETAAAVTAAPSVAR
jgi:UDPglucose--hexose-1-phosphate uridylyltransferase